MDETERRTPIAVPRDLAERMLKLMVAGGPRLSALSGGEFDERLEDISGFLSCFPKRKDAKTKEPFDD